MITGYTKSLGTHLCDDLFGENENTDIGKSQRLANQGNRRITMVYTMTPGVGKRIDNGFLSRRFESSDNNLYIAEHGC